MTLEWIGRAENPAVAGPSGTGKPEPSDKERQSPMTTTAGQGRERDWTLSKIVWVADRGFASAANRRYLRSGDHHYIIGEKLRSNSPEIKAALSRQGRYQDIAHNMRVKPEFHS